MPLHVIRYGVEPGPAHRPAVHSFARSPRVLLETDAASAEALPAAIRAAADGCAAGTLPGWTSVSIPSPGDGPVDRPDGVLTWLSGEQLLCGSPAVLRQALGVPGRRSFFALHLPYLEEMPLLAIEPRCLARGPHRREVWNLALRIAAAARLSTTARAALDPCTEPWARLSLALYAELASPGAGLEPLVRLWEARASLDTRFAALLLRNLFLLRLRHGAVAEAEQLLALGLSSYPGYGELGYLAALWHLRENRPARALPYLGKTENADAGFLGCGGEASYRTGWLRGLLALRVGNERVAFDCLRAGLLSHPPFRPSAEALLARGWPRPLVAAHQAELCLAALRQPAFEPQLFEFLLRHRCFAAATELLAAAPAPLAPALRETQQERLRAAAAPYRPPAEKPSGPSTRAGLLWQGPLFEHTSLARINRELAAQVLDNTRWQMRLEPSAPAALPPELFAHGPRLTDALLAPLERLNLTVRQQWPPDFRRPETGRLAVILPWEYGAVPLAWVRAIEENVDELWVPSEFVRGVFARGGVTATPIAVLPNGFDPLVFTPRGTAARPVGSRGFLFLFVGGAIRRKGLDLLLEAYRAAFDSAEDVTLALQLSGLTGSYRHNSLTERVQQLAADPRAPHLQVLTATLDDASLAGLYRGCDALLLPYRGEGFGLPLLEAMACGKPVIATAAGPANEFCDEHSAYLLPACEQPVPDEPPPLGPLTGPFTWFEPDFAALVDTLRQVFEHRQQAAACGRRAAQRVHRTHTWERVAARYRTRIEALTAANRGEKAKGK